ncbi:MAG TPA: OsmC family protein [Chloroflexota bacterium]|nr:OsmC family protein [Chloroflexota bacterium]
MRPSEAGRHHETALRLHGGGRGRHPTPEATAGERPARHGARREYPRAFERIAVHYDVRGQDIVEAAVERAITLSEEKYCSVAATLRGGATITTSFTIVEEGSTIQAPNRRR